MGAQIGQEGVDHLKGGHIDYDIRDSSFKSQEMGKVLPVGGGRVGSNPGGGTEKSILPSTWSSLGKKGHDFIPTLLG